MSFTEYIKTSAPRNILHNTSLSHLLESNTSHPEDLAHEPWVMVQVWSKHKQHWEYCCTDIAEFPGWLWCQRVV